MKIIRWMGAFRNGGTLSDSLSWELDPTQADVEVAAEPLQKNERSEIRFCRIGLLLKRSSVIKMFSGDCWSERNEEGTLVKTRNPRRAYSRHQECWCRKEYAALVVRDRGNINKKSWKIIQWFSKKYNLPILEMDRNWKEVGM
jgi:hypothetical protein